jgi:hypothetical protein
MKEGSYQARRVDFAPFDTCSFNPYLFSEAVRAGVGCGPSTLALLTGELPRSIAAENHNRPHTSASFMVKFLRARGYSVFELTRWHSVSSRTKIGPNHLVLLAQVFRRLEGTWSVLHNNFFTRQFLASRMVDLDLTLDAPTLTAAAKVLGEDWSVLREGDPHPQPTSRPLRQVLGNAVWWTCIRPAMVRHRINHP